MPTARYRIEGRSADGMLEATILSCPSDEAAIDLINAEMRSKHVTIEVWRGDTQIFAWKIPS